MKCVKESGILPLHTNENVLHGDASLMPVLNCREQDLSYNKRKTGMIKYFVLFKVKSWLLYLYFYRVASNFN